MLKQEDKEVIKEIGKYRYNQMKEKNFTYKEYLEYLKSKQKEKELKRIIGNYQYNQMKKLSMTYEQYLNYKEQKKQESKLKKQIGYREYNKMKEMGLTQEEYKQYQKEQKLKKYERKREKDKIRFKTIRYIERYCNLEMKCQICNIENDIQIHHPNYNDYLKINLLCRKHHAELHNFELIPPEVIDLEKIAIQEPILATKQNYIKEQLKNMKKDVFNNSFTYLDLTKKYKISNTTIATYFKKEKDYELVKNKLEENVKKKSIIKKNSNKANPLIEYKQKHNVSSKDISKITNIPLPTLRAIECGKTDFSKIKPTTKAKLQKIIQNAR